MSFTSVVFPLFSLFFFLGWPLIRPYQNPRYLYICVFSLIFYGWLEPRYVPLLLLTGLVDFSAGLAMERFNSHRKHILIASLICNLGVLGLFKYSAFFVSIVQSVLPWQTTLTDYPLFHLALPVGISFYTFQSMNYTISVYRKDVRATHNFLHFLSFISLFPHLVAGPLVRAADILPQLAAARPTGDLRRWKGLRLIVSGYFKKMVLADNLAPAVNDAFGGANYGPLYYWIAVVMFSAQIYCDFSGYTDIARGLARWMGIEFGLNFNHPYCATSFREFWQRWHISLSTWFRDYVYIPLGGSRSPGLRAHINMWITMLVSGLWHGASWNFLLWGLLHSIYLSLERTTQWHRRLGNGIFARCLRWFIVFFAVCLAWVFFRASSLTWALEILNRMTNPGGWEATDRLQLQMMRKQLGVMAIAALAAFTAIEAWVFFRLHLRYARLYLRCEPLILGILAVLAIYLRGPASAFIYFRF